MYTCIEHANALLLQCEVGWSVCDSAGWADYYQGSLGHARRPEDASGT